MSTRLHPLIRELERRSLTKPTAAQIRSIAKVAKQGGVTPSEERVLEDVFDAHAPQWTDSVRNRWQTEVASLPISLRPTRNTRPDSAGTEDLSSNIKVVLTQGYKNEEQRAYIADLVRCGKKYGFRVVVQLSPGAPIEKITADLKKRTGLSLAKLDEMVDIVKADWGFSDWGEDNKILTNANDKPRRVKVLTPPTVGDRAFDQAIAYTEYEGHHAYTPDSFQGAVSYRDEGTTARKLARRIGRKAKETSVYVEGGNLLPGTTSDGKPYALVGRDTLIVSAFHLMNEGIPSKSAVKAQMSKMKGTKAPSEAEIEAAANGLLQVEQSFYARAPMSVTPRLRKDAKQFLARVELTKKIMAKDLGIPVSRLVFVTQPEFHIDMHMRPLANGEVMVNHPKMCIALIDKALKDTKLKSWQKSELLDMRLAAEDELETLGPVADEIIGQLEAAGLIAIPAPGVFESWQRRANFMNGVPGTTEDGTTFYMTTGSTITPLQRAFSSFVRGLGVDKVDFVANAGGSMSKLSAGEISLEADGALDCRQVHHGGKSGVKRDALQSIA